MISRDVLDGQVVDGLEVGALALVDLVEEPLEPISLLDRLVVDEVEWDGPSPLHLEEQVAGGFGGTCFHTSTHSIVHVA